MFMRAKHKKKVNHTLKRLTMLFGLIWGHGSKQVFYSKNGFRIKYLISIHPNLGEIAEQLNHLLQGTELGACTQGYRTRIKLVSV